MTIFQPPFRPMPSPCIGLCRLGADGRCEGCHRTPEEIARWTSYTDAERLYLMTDVLPGRAEAGSS